MPAPNREQLGETLARAYFQAYDNMKKHNDEAGRDAWHAVADVVIADMQRAHNLVIEVAQLRKQVAENGQGVL